MLPSTSQFHTGKKTTPNEREVLQYEPLEGNAESLNKAFDILFEAILQLNQNNHGHINKSN